MASASKIQLISPGLEDVYLTGNPDVTYFKQIYKRHTRFGTQTLTNVFNNSVKFGGDNECRIERMGDLVTGMYLVVTMPSLKWDDAPGGPATVYGWQDSIGNALIEWMDLKIGGQTIQRINGDLMEVHGQLFMDDSVQRGLKSSIGKVFPLGRGVTATPLGSNGDFRLIIPLPFYFHMKPSLAIPLCAITRQDVTLDVRFRDVMDLLYPINENARNWAVKGNPNNVAFTNFVESLQPKNATILTDYVYITEEEVNIFKNRTIDYIITQNQRVNVEPVPDVSGTVQIEGKFVNPVKEFFVLVRRNSSFKLGVPDFPFSDGTAYTNAQSIFYLKNDDNTGSNPPNHHLRTMEVRLNNAPIVDSDVADKLFLGSIQPMNRHSRVSDYGLIYVYSFSIDPESEYPTGQINMSRIANQTFIFDLFGCSFTRRIDLYAKSFNVLRVQNGLVGILYIDKNTF